MVGFGEGDREEVRRIILGQAQGELVLGPAGEGDLPCPSWVLPNREGLGYYRFNLEEPYWVALAEGLHSLEPREALAVVDSAIASFRAGSLSAETLLDLVEASAQSTRRQVVTYPFDLLRELSSWGFSKEHRGDFHRYLQALYGPRNEVLAEATGEEELRLRTALRDFLATAAQDPAVRRDLSHRAARFLGLEAGAEPDPEALSADEYALAFGVAIQDLGRPFFERLRDARGDTDDAFFREASITALGRAHDPELAREALAYAMAEDHLPSTRATRIPQASGSRGGSAFHSPYACESSVR